VKHQKKPGFKKYIFLKTNVKKKNNFLVNLNKKTIQESLKNNWKIKIILQGWWKKETMKFKRISLSLTLIRPQNKP